MELQERDLELTAEDFMKMKEEDSEVDGAEVQGQQTAPEPEPEPDEEAESEAEPGTNKRRAYILLQFLTAGLKLEDRLEAYQDEIDEEMLTMLAQRIEATRLVAPNNPVIEAWQELYRILKIVYQKQTSTPAMRLLNEVLCILGDDAKAADYEERCLQAKARMYDAFTGGTTGLDIFAAAAALAEGGPEVAAQLGVEYVRHWAFYKETKDLLMEARQRQQELQQAIDQEQQELDKIKEQNPAALRTRGNMHKAQQVALARQAYAEREAGLKQLGSVLGFVKEMGMVEEVQEVQAAGPADQ